jgi:hypothetical protein
MTEWQFHDSNDQFNPDLLRVNPYSIYVDVDVISDCLGGCIDSGFHADCYWHGYIFPNYQAVSLS